MVSDFTLEQIKKTVSCLTYLDKSPKGNYICPYCGSGTGSDQSGAVTYYRDTNQIHCFSCGIHKNVIQLRMKVMGETFTEAISSLSAELNLNTDAEQGLQMHTESHIRPIIRTDDILYADKPKIDLTDYYRECAERITDPAAVDYLQKRGISLETAKRCLIGYDPQADPSGKGYHTGRIIAPNTKYSYTTRAIEDSIVDNYKKLNNAGVRVGIFNYNVLHSGSKFVFVTEGFFDALSFEEVGVPAIALNSKENGKKLTTVLQRYPTNSQLLVCFDHENSEEKRTKTGFKAAELVETLNEQSEITAFYLDLCGGYKDPNEYLINDRQGFIERVRKETDETFWA